MSHEPVPSVPHVPGVVAPKAPPVLDASDLARGPLATIVLPERLGAGTHACWVEGDRIAGEGRRLA